jgi:hypothetical protein
MKYAVEMGSGAMIYIPSFIKIVSVIRKLIGGGIHRQHGDLISLLLTICLQHTAALGRILLISE